MVILTPAAFECCWTTTSLPDPLRCSSSHRAGDPYDRGANDFRDHWADTEPEWSHGDTWLNSFVPPPKPLTIGN
jgi:hypothetical protein